MCEYCDLENFKPFSDGHGMTGPEHVEYDGSQPVHFVSPHLERWEDGTWSIAMRLDYETASAEVDNCPWCGRELND